MRAIVFDFFGTLTDPDAEAGRRPSFAATATALGVGTEQFCATMAATFPQRATGVHGGTRDTLRAVARACGADPAEERLDVAVKVHRAGAERLRRPRTGALATLDRLRAAGLRLGLISDCSSELCEAWADTPYASRLDAAVFSWREGHRKPDPRLYATVAARLDVPVSECWYVGDGGSRELFGAHRAGMRPVLVTNAAHPAAGGYRDDPDPFVPAHRIDDLPALLPLLGATRPGTR